MIDKRDVQESIDSYLGDSEIQILKTIDKRTLALFLSKKVQLNTSYFVRGTEKLLNQFKAYYLVLSNKESIRLKHGKYMISEYAQHLTQQTLDDDIGVEELLFLYSHDNESKLGNSELWLTTTIINEVANRTRKGYTTIILSERSIPDIEKSKEVKVINLLSNNKKYTLKKVTENIGHKSSNNYY